MPRDYIHEPLRRNVIQRADNRCEYCGLSQEGQEATFHVDHILPLAAGGKTEAENLALACVSCSLRKGARHLIVDPETGTAVRIFNPRANRFETHFARREARISGITAVGRATVAALGFNQPLTLAARDAQRRLKRYPPSNL
jgi:hypothetical protein